MTVKMKCKGRSHTPGRTPKNNKGLKRKMRVKKNTADEVGGSSGGGF
jgi:hypothetical protein